MPKRFVFVVKSSGIDKFNLVPEGLENHFVSPEDGKKLGNRGRREGPLVDVALADHKLPSKLKQVRTMMVILRQRTILWIFKPRYPRNWRSRIREILRTPTVD